MGSCFSVEHKTLEKETKSTLDKNYNSSSLVTYPPTSIILHNENNIIDDRLIYQTRISSGGLLASDQNVQSPIDIQKETYFESYLNNY